MMSDNDHDQALIAAQAAAFRRLVQHFQDHQEVQNIDLMTLAGFCRNCLSKWYLAEAERLGTELEIQEAQAFVYGMPYAEWKAQYQLEASPEQVQAFEAAQQKRQAKQSQLK